jgi:hypothetical protein
VDNTSSQTLGSSKHPQSPEPHNEDPLEHLVLELTLVASLHKVSPGRTPPPTRVTILTRIDHAPLALNAHISFRVPNKRSSLKPELLRSDKHTTGLSRASVAYALQISVPNLGLWRGKTVCLTYLSCNEPAVYVLLRQKFRGKTSAS